MKQMNKYLVMALMLLAAPAHAEINYSKWSWTGPVDANGKLEGTAKLYKPITDTFQKPPYYVINGDGSRTAFAPVKGARTSKNTKYTRSEWRELDDNGKEIAWSLKNGTVFTTIISVEEVGITTKKEPGGVEVNQFHGVNDELMRLYYKKGLMSFRNDKSGATGKEKEFILLSTKTGKPTNIPLGDKFSTIAEANLKGVTVTVVYKDEIFVASDTINSFWLKKENDKFYSKFGVYNAVGAIGSGAGTEGTGNGKVIVYDAVVSHGTTETPKPTPPAGWCECPK